MDLDFETFFEAAQRAGIYGITPKDLRAWMPLLKARGYQVAVFESYEVRAGRQYPTWDLSLFGADGPENWENHRDPLRHERLIHRKLAAAETSGLRIEYQVWIEPYPE